MIGLLLRVAAVLVTSFMLAVGAILAQPRDDSAMRAFFSPPEGCAAPCFLGIRPGVTTRDEAVAILSAHPWIHLLDRGDEGLAWTWNGQQPAFIDRFANNFLIARIDLTNGIVRAIHLPTTTRWADIYLLFGKPDLAITYSTFTPSNHFRAYDAAYLADNMEVESSTRCPVTSRLEAWYSIVFITWPISGPVVNGERGFSREC